MEDLILNSLAKYYGLDWAAFALGMAGMYMITMKSRWGFALTALSALCGFAVAGISLQFGYVAYNALIIAIMVKGFYEWRIKPAPVAAE